MRQPINRLEAEALELPSHERARLAHTMIASLDGEPEEDPAKVERAWAEEIERRLADYRSRAVQPIPASQVFAEARAQLR